MCIGMHDNTGIIAISKSISIQIKCKWYVFVKLKEHKIWYFADNFVSLLLSWNEGMISPKSQNYDCTNLVWFQSNYSHAATMRLTTNSVNIKYVLYRSCRIILFSWAELCMVMYVLTEISAPCAWEIWFNTMGRSLSCACKSPDHKTCNAISCADVEGHFPRKVALVTPAVDTEVMQDS